jgi:hypothetical protein
LSGKPIWAVDLGHPQLGRALSIQRADSYSEIACSTKPDP